MHTPTHTQPVEGLVENTDLSCLQIFPDAFKVILMTGYKVKTQITAQNSHSKLAGDESKVGQSDFHSVHPGLNG